VDSFLNLMERRFRPPAGLVAMLRQDFYSRGGSGVRLDYNGTSSDGGQPSRRSLPSTRRTEPPQQPVVGGNEGTRPASTSTEGPTAWAGSVGDTTTVTVGHLELGPGLRVKYVGPGAQDSDAAILMSNNPVPSDQPVYCFEVEIVNKGAEGFIGVGYSRKGIPNNVLPGWKDGSFGYHGDDGKIFGGNGRGEDYGPTFTTGDTISCIWCQVNRTISFAKNGMDLGVAFRNVDEPQLYPTIGLRTRQEEVVANFGATPLRSSVHTYKLSELRQAARREVDAVQLPFSPRAPGSSTSLHEIVHAYLQHSGYPSAAAAMAEAGLDCQDLQDTATKDAEVRARIQSTILAGQIDRAEELIEELAPGMLDQEGEVKFRMQCQKFMEMCKDGDDVGTVAFGVAHLSDGGRWFPQGPDMVKDAALMLAFPDTAEDSQSAVVRLSYRRMLASVINSALQVRAGRPAHSVLERLLSQLKVVLQTLHNEGDLLSDVVHEDIRCGADEDSDTTAHSPTEF